MTDGHTFIDSDDNVLAGKADVLKAWEGFFNSFPDYRNDWSRVIPTGGTLFCSWPIGLRDRASTGRSGDLDG